MSCTTLRQQYDAAMALNPPDLIAAQAAYDAMAAAGCPDLPEDPEGSGGHGNEIPPHG